MQIDIGQRGEISVVAITGSLDTKTAPQAEAALNQLLAQGHHKLAIDFDGLDYISSSGLRVLLSTMKKLKKSKGKMRLCGMNPTVKEVFDISGFSGIFSIHASRQDALAGF